MEDDSHNLLSIGGDEPSQKKSYGELAAKYGLHAVLIVCILLIIAVIYNAPTYWLTGLGVVALGLLGWLSLR